MRARFLSLSKGIASYFLQARKFAAPAASSYVTHHCDAHMNELPIPCGPWDDFYKSRQGYYTQTLIAGIAWWLFSLFMMLYTGSFYLNWGPPSNPGPPSDMVEECTDIE